MIEAGVGLSSASSTVVAASEAAAHAASGLSGGHADLAIVFATGDHAEEIPSLLSSVERATGTPYIVGCSAAGVIAQGRELEDYAEVLVRKVEAVHYPSIAMLNRLDGLLDRLEQAERRERQEAAQNDGRGD